MKHLPEHIAKLRGIQLSLLKSSLHDLSGADIRILLHWGKLGLQNISKAKQYMRKAPSQHWADIHQASLEILESVAMQLPICICDPDLDSFAKASIADFASKASQILYEEALLDKGNQIEPSEIVSQNELASMLASVEATNAKSS